MSFRNQFLVGDSAKVLQLIPQYYVDQVVTSIPYFNLRDYGFDNQIGREKILDDYIEALMPVFDECHRVLKPTGTCWVNVGDTFAGTKVGNTNGLGKSNKKFKNGINDMQFKKDTIDFPDKCLMMVPEEFARAMIRRNRIKPEIQWILRSKIFWYKPNGMIESSKDRVKLDYEMLYQFSKQQKYYFNYTEAKRPLKTVTIKRHEYGIGSIESLGTGANTRHSREQVYIGPKIGGNKHAGHNGNSTYEGKDWKPTDNMGKIGSVWIPPDELWTIAPKSFGHEYCPSCDKLVKSRDLLFKCRNCGLIIERADPAEILKKNGIDPDKICEVCGRSLKRHVSPNSKDRVAGIKPEVISCARDIPALDAIGCPACFSEDSDLACPDCKNLVHMHYAMYPEELVEKILKIGCPDQVCSQCGVPRFPVYKPSEQYAKYLGKSWHEHKNDLQAGMQQAHKVPVIPAEYFIDNWTKCNCNAPFQPAIVLDPFAGLNTTGSVALQLGHDFISIDIDPLNAKAGLKRVEKYLQPRLV